MYQTRSVWLYRRSSATYSTTPTHWPPACMVFVDESKIAQRKLEAWAQSDQLELSVTLQNSWRPAWLETASRGAERMSVHQQH